MFLLYDTGQLQLIDAFAEVWTNQVQTVVRSGISSGDKADLADPAIAIGSMV